ncbi:MAG TPA: response regulator [Polyangiaceae bacterium]
MTTPDACRPISGIRRRPACVLIIDDDPRIAHPLGELLSDEFAVRATSSPREAFASILLGAWYDVILCDVMMPEMTGIDFHEDLQALHPLLAARIVFMTGGVGDEHLQDVLDSMPNLVLEKPVDVEDLRELIRRRLQVDPPRRRHSA